MARSRSGRKKEPLDLWRIGWNVLSGIFMTVGIFFLFMALAEVLIYLIDIMKYGNRGYLDWWSTPLLMILSSIPFFLGYFLLNLNRYSTYRKLKNRLRIRPPSDHEQMVDEIEL